MTYVYDSADRLDHVTDWASRVTQYAYDGHSRLSTISLPNGTVRTYGYDSAGRVNLIQDSGSGGVIISRFKLDHDPLDRISKEIVTPEPAAFTITPASMTYDDDDRLATWNGQTCASDPDGNLTTGPLQGSLTTFSFDARNRLSGVGNTTYTYDAENRRVAVTLSGSTTSYVNDPQGALSRLLVAASVSSTTRYVYANGILLYGDNGSGLQVHHFDPRGSTVAITGSTGTVTDRVVYGDYGEIVSRTGTTATPFLFNGAYGVQTDSNGLYFMRARYYSAETRRFINADPLGFGGGNNWFAFVNGEPVDLIDPFGLCADHQVQPCIMCHGESAFGYNGDPNSFYGLSAIPGSGPNALEGYNTLEQLTQILAPFLAGPGGDVLAGVLDAALADELASTGQIAATINGIDYSAHALDQMQARGIVPSVVQNTIENGTTFTTRAGTIGYYDAVNNVRVIVNSQTGKVVTVIPGAP